MSDAHLPAALRRRDDRSAIEEGLTPYRGTTIEERSEILSALCRNGAEQIAGRQDGWRMLAHRDPRSTESEPLWLRLVAATRTS